MIHYLQFYIPQKSNCIHCDKKQVICILYFCSMINSWFNCIRNVNSLQVITLNFFL